MQITKQEDGLLVKLGDEELRQLKYEVDNWYTFSREYEVRYELLEKIIEVDGVDNANN